MEQNLFIGFKKKHGQENRRFVSSTSGCKDWMWKARADR